MSFAKSSLPAGVLAAVLASSLFACVIEDAPPRQLGPNTDPPPPSAAPAPSGSGAPAPPSSGAPTTPTAPMLVTLDTDQVMNADAGQGVGIFTEYGAGGKWHVWWTCDTAKSNQDCDVSLSATAASGNIFDVDSRELANGFVTAPTPSRVEARVKTTTEVHGIRFKTNPGAVITLEATVGGLKEGPGQNQSFFFFVQGGKINGGFTGRLTNPLQLQGSAP